MTIQAAQATNGNVRARTWARARIGATFARLSGALLLLVACILAAGRPTLAAEAGPGLFGSTEQHFTNLHQFAKWQAAIRRYRQAEQSCLAGGCEGSAWHGFLDSLRGLDRRSLLVAVNARINQARYVEDRVNWRVADYWETPFELLSRGGDCEDYAVAKYFALRELGVRADEMRIAIVWDRGLHRFHAVVAVDLEGRPVVLDNQRQWIGAADRPSIYVPLYSVNEEGWWLHQDPGRLPRAVAPAAGTRVEKQLSSTGAGETLSPIIRVGEADLDGERRAARN